MRPGGEMSLVDQRGRKYLTCEERADFAAAIRAYPQPQVQTLARVLMLTGCRVSEALGLRVCDVDLDAEELRISTLKRRTEHWRVVPVPAELAHELDLVHRVRARQGSPRARRRALWDITRQAAHRQVAKLMRDAGVRGPQACPRGLRHSFGIAGVQAGVPLPVLASIMGHSSIETTAIYTTAIGLEARELVSRMWQIEAR